MFCHVRQGMGTQQSQLELQLAVTIPHYNIYTTAFIHLVGLGRF